jgi:hypothetical protein
MDANISTVVGDPSTDKEVTPTAAPAALYLAVSAGLDENNDKVIDEGGLLFAVPATNPLLITGMELAEQAIDPGGEPMTLEKAITIPGYRFKLPFGLVVKGGPLPATFEVQIQVVTAEQLAALPKFNVAL